LADARWLLGPPERDPTTGAGLLFARVGIEPEHVVGYSSHAAALAAAAAGDGIVATYAHAVLEELRRRALTRIDIRGTPLVEMWHASTLGFGRALPAALALQRFATSPEATAAISTGRAGSVSARARPRPHVTLWSSVAAELRADGR
jgi:DNA-binding transcriptional LysR family regulator